MTRSELASWCVEVTDERTEEPMSTEDLTPLEAAKTLYTDRETVEAELQQIRSDLAQAIRQARESHSLAEIAQELGVSRQRIHQISSEEQS
jgi:DNA-directed RNA polymerase specialized sigma24 family protein